MLGLFVPKNAFALRAEFGSRDLSITTYCKHGILKKLEVCGTNNSTMFEHVVKPKSFSALLCFCLLQEKLGRVKECVASLL